MHSRTVVKESVHKSGVVLLTRKMNAAAVGVSTNHQV